MATIVLGKQGESLAKEYLIDLGYQVLQTNYKNKIGEIDIIAKDSKTIVFIEVKTRQSTRFGLSREAVNFYKQQKIRNVAIGYLKFKGLYEKVPVRFDVIDIIGTSVTHIKNAF